ncbi:Uncharacterised protein [Mycobacteroides abscessus subsp. abscessus]|nr:Uncharacterised protein [Mycobacteroides abscessus subsp. abscessus]
MARATAIGRAIAMFLGTSSPSTIDSDVAMSSANTSERTDATDSLTPIARNAGPRICASTGSAM